MEAHADADASHGELGDAGLEELAGEVALGEGVGLLEEAVGLVGVGEVGRCDDHVLDLGCEGTEDGSGCCAGCGAWLLLDGVPVDFRSLAGEEVLEFGCEFGVSFSPSSLLGVALGNDLLEFGSALSVELFDLGEDLEWVVGVAAKVGDGVAVSVAAEWCAVGGAVVLVAAVVCLAGAFAHDGVTDDEGRLAFDCLSLADCLAELVGVVAFLYLDDFPAPSLIFLSCVLGGDGIGLGGELDVVGVVEHDEVVEAEAASEAACALGDLLLYAAVGDVGVDGLTHYLTEASLEELGCDGCADGEGVTLAERTGGVLDAAHDVDLRVSWGGGAPLAELLELVHGEFAGEGEDGVEHGGHVARVEEEAVAALPTWVLGVVDEELAEEDVDEVGAAHGSAWVTRVGLLDH